MGAVASVQSLGAAMWSMASAQAAVDSMGQGGAANLASQYASYGAGKAGLNVANRESGPLYTPFQTAQQTAASGHAAALEKIEIDHQATMADIQATAAAARLDDTSTLFGAAASIAEAGGKKSAKAAAALAAVQTTVSGYAAAMSAAALAPTLLGKAAVYAGWLATSAKAVAAINSAGGGGGGRGRGIGGASPAAQAVAPQAPQSRLIVQGIKLTDIITGEMLMQILGKEFGARNVEFIR